MPAQDKSTSARILQAASKLFTEKGFSNVSIRDVCRASGITAPVLYYYFGSKKELFEAVVGETVSMRGFIDELNKAAGRADPPKGLESFVEAYLALFPTRAFRPGLYLRESATLDRDTARMVSGELDEVQAIATSLIERGMKSGDFRETDPMLAADCLLGMLNRVIFQHLHFAKASDREAYGKFVTEFFIRAMKA